MEIKVGDHVRFDQADSLFHRDDPRYHAGIVTDVETPNGMIVVTRTDGSEWNAPVEHLVKVEKENNT